MARSHAANGRGAELPARLRAGPPLLLDGATGTELERRGARTGLPLWSAHALLEQPQLLERIHADYAAAGCEVLTANTFRTQRRTLATAGLGERAADLTALAVTLARRGARCAASATPLVAGSLPPLADCYRPDRVPEDAALDREHSEHAEHLCAAGVDLVLMETMNTVREARAAARAACAAGLPFFASFVCQGAARLLSGEPLAAGLDAVAPFGPLALLVNCLPPSAVPEALRVLSGAGLPYGAYPNLGAPNDETGFTRSEDCPPDAFAALLAGWADAGARVLGGCCGTTPDHLRAVATRLQRTRLRG